MSLVTLLVALIIIGVALYLVQLIPMNPVIRQIIFAIAIAAIAIYAIKLLLPMAGVA